MKANLLLCLLLLGCGKPALHHFAGAAFDIEYHIQIGHRLNESQEARICSIIQTVFGEIHSTFNQWNPESVLSLGATSNELELVLRYADVIKELTGGRFDAVQGSSMELKTGKASPVDLDGIIKGYAIDKITNSLERDGYKNVFVSWGGEMRTMGRHPEKRPWRVLIKGGDGIDLGGALATSGTYEQRYGDYTHIIDPKTQKPLLADQELVSVSVSAPTCILADSLATAVMVCKTKEKAEKFVTNLKKYLPQIEVWIHCTKHEDTDI